MTQNVFITYIWWHYAYMPKLLIEVWQNFLWFGLNYFSVPLLIKTLFSPWRRIYVGYARRFDPTQWFNALSFNLMSRGIGAIIRLGTIIVGLIIEAGIVVVGLTLILLWLFLPLIILTAFLFGFLLLI